MTQRSPRCGSCHSLPEAVGGDRGPVRPPEERVQLDMRQLEASCQLPSQPRLAGAARAHHVDPLHRAQSVANRGRVQARAGAGTMPQIWRPQSRARSDARPATDRPRRPPSARSADRRFRRTPASGRAAWTATSSRIGSASGAPAGIRIGVAAWPTKGPRATSGSSLNPGTRRHADRSVRANSGRMRSTTRARAAAGAAAAAAAVSASTEPPDITREADDWTERPSLVPPLPPSEPVEPPPPAVP